MQITRPHFEKKRRDKQRKILDAARLVFCRKGFLAVKMQDIIDECGISRGGIYIYFSSVDEIFLEVMKDRGADKLCDIKKGIVNNSPFPEVFDMYMAKQKQRLSQFEQSLFRAYCEYIFSKPKAAVHAFRDSQLSQLRGSVEDVLALGARQGCLDAADIKKLAVHFIAMVDGLSILALGDALTNDIIETQFEILEKIIFRR